jgi:HlyD family secretion protein
MSIEALPEKSRRPQLLRTKKRGNCQDSYSNRRWKRVIIIIVVITAIASATALVPSVGSSRDIGPRLTHTIKRGDLIVTVTEKGTLESSENTEIKCKVRTEAVPIIWVIESGTEVKTGDELVRLETLDYDDRLNEVTKWVHMTRSAAERSRADVARAELAIPEYLEGQYRSELMRLQKDLAIAESNLRTAQNMLGHAEKMAARGYVSELEVQEKTFAITQAELNVEVKKTEIEVLRNFTKAMELETLNGNLNASKAKHEADKEMAKHLVAQVELARADIEFCVVKAETSGLVIYPTARPWERTPEIEEGASVYMGQNILLMPDLTRMQVKFSIHESFIDRMKPGLTARVTLPNRILTGEVSSVASVAWPAGEWNGYVVKYETIVKLPSVKGLKPGMSAEVEVILAQHENVLTIPVAAVVETSIGNFCWVKTASGAERRSLQLGDTNDVFTIVETGLQEGDKVVLHPLALKEAQALSIEQRDEEKPQESTKPSAAPGDGTKSKSPDKSKKQISKPQGRKSKQMESESTIK